MKPEVKEVIDLLMKHGEEIEFMPSKEALRLFRQCVVPSNMGGLWKTAFTCMVFGEGDMRQLNAYMLFSQIRLCGNEIFTLEHMKALFRDTVPLSANFLATCGFEQLWDYTQKILNVLDLIQDKAEYRQMLDAYCFYVTNLHNWCHYFFPWYVGDLFPQKTHKELEELQDALNM